ncbi:MAG: phosphodiester glycosidase family protein [Acidobacteria bacterium]|nr:phosphodiester glycosidase family protein [Acidobacteriota bacterium]
MNALSALLLALGLASHPTTPGMTWSRAPMATSGPLAYVDVIVVRMDPGRLQFQLQREMRDYGLQAAWTIDMIPDHGVVAFNAGQFIGGFPWGWLVMDGVEQQPPGTGSLAMSFVVDHNGKASLLAPDEVPAPRGKIQFAFQSYPMLLSGNADLPWELQAPGRGVRLTHRDSRLALGLRADGSVIVALTRFTGAGAIGERLPFGPTVAEMAEFMRSQGCVRAMMLDGGLSSQLALRNTKGSVERWPNWRPVPLAVVALAR